MDFGGVNQRGAAAPEFNSANGVMGQISSTMDTLKGNYASLSALLRELSAEQANQPKAPDTKGMKSEDAAKVMQKFQQDLNSWKGKINQLKGAIRQVQKKVEKNTQKLGELQGVKLPQAQAKDASDMEKWQEDQKKALEALSAPANQEVVAEDVGGDANVAVVRAEMAKIQLASAGLDSLIAAAAANELAGKPPEAGGVINTEAETQAVRHVQGGPARNDGLTMP